jgi:hypothetical protein
LADKGYVEVEDGVSGHEDEDEAESDTITDPSSNDMASLNKQLNAGAKKEGPDQRFNPAQMQSHPACMFSYILHLEY